MLHKKIEARVCAMDSEGILHEGNWSRFELRPEGLFFFFREGKENGEEGKRSR